MRTAFVVVLLVVGLAACPSPPVPPAPASCDAAAPASCCAAACDRLRTLGCPEGEPSPGGVPCVEVCARAAQHLRPACIAAAVDVDALHACDVRCVP